VFCFDATGGREAAWKALSTTLPHLREAESPFLFLPEGETRIPCAREGAEAFAAGAQAQPLSEFLYARLSAGLDVTTLDGRPASPASEADARPAAAGPFRS